MCILTLTRSKLLHENILLFGFKTTLTTQIKPYGCLGFCMEEDTWFVKVNMWHCVQYCIVALYAVLYVALYAVSHTELSMKAQAGQAPVKSKAMGFFFCVGRWQYPASKDIKYAVVKRTGYEMTHCRVLA